MITRLDEYTALRNCGYLNEDLMYNVDYSDIITESRSADKARKKIFKPVVDELDNVITGINSDIDKLEEKIKKQFGKSADLKKIPLVSSTLERAKAYDYTGISKFRKLSTAKTFLSPFKRKRVNSISAEYYYSMLSSNLINVFTQMYGIVLNYTANVESIIRDNNTVLYNALQNKVLRNLLQSGMADMAKMNANKQLDFIKAMKKDLNSSYNDNNYFEGYNNLNLNNKLINGDSVSMLKKQQELIAKQVEKYKSDSNSSIANYAELMELSAVEKAAAVITVFETSIIDVCNSFSVANLKNLVSNAALDQTEVITLDQKEIEAREKKEQEEFSKRQEELETKIEKEAKKEETEEKKEESEKKEGSEKKEETEEKKEESGEKKKETKDTEEYKDSKGNTYKREGDEYTMTDEKGETIEIEEEDFEENKPDSY